MKYDICIIGGGAAGLAAAASFNKETKVCILEKNETPGRKLLATGGGRCNLTNESCEEHEKILDFFRRLGIETKCDGEGRYYPYTNRASDVVKALVGAIDGNVDLRCGFRVNAVTKIREEDMDGFTVTGYDTAEGDMEMIVAKKVLIATGGKAAPQYGTTGDGYSIAKSLGHTITKLYPILCGIKCKATNVEFVTLKGIRATGIVKLMKDGRLIAKETGEIQFTEEGISGICVFNLTPHIKTDVGEAFADAMKRYTIAVDLAPDFTQEEIAERTDSFGILTESLADAVDITKIKNWELQVTGVKGWRDAQATSGGISIEEIDMNRMESRLVRNLYFAGEIIDIQGACGGFNLQNAWETGIRAALSMEK